MKRPVSCKNDGIDFRYTKPHAKFHRIKVSLNMLSLKLCPDFVTPYDCTLLVFRKICVRFGLLRETECPLCWVLKRMTMSLFKEASEIFSMYFFPPSVRNSPSNYRDL